MYDQWKVLHLDEVEAESVLFCRALAQEQFAGHCETVHGIDQAKLYLERALYTPRLLSRPDIIVINCHPDCDVRVLDFVHWVRVRQQFQATPIILFVKAPLSFAVQERAEYEGITELVVRPETFEELLTQVRALLERCASRCVVR